MKPKLLSKVLGQERNGDVVEKLKFSDEFCHLSSEFCDELNHDFLELFKSSICNCIGTPLDVDIDEEFDEEERLLLEEEKMVRLEEPKRLMIEEECAFEVKKRKDEDYRRMSYAFMNSDHMKQAMARCAIRKRTELLTVRTDSWLQICRSFSNNSEIDNIWIGEDLDIYLGQPSHLRWKFPWSIEGCLPEVLELVNVFDKKGIDKSTYRVTFRIAENVPKHRGVFGDCEVWVCIFLYRSAHDISLDMEDPLWAAFAYRERMA
nr:F-box domain-containing protein [Tanacetum cinerariifolium]